MNRFLAVALLTIGCLVFSLGSRAGQKGKGPNSPERVPPGKSYVVYDDKGKQVAKFKSGEATGMVRGDCVEVDCPGSFDKDVTCWKCKPRKGKAGKGE